MSELSREALEALAPLRAFLAKTALDEAEATRAAVQGQVDALLSKANSEHDRILAEATEDGTHAAQAVAALGSARVRRQANEVVLSQREQIRQRLRSSVDEAATALCDGSQYPELRRRLVARGRALLGKDATVVDAPNGGVLITSDSRRLDLSLPALATAALDTMEAEASSLWMR